MKGRRQYEAQSLVCEAIITNLQMGLVQTENSNVITPASLRIRGEQRVHHSTIPGLDEPDVLVLDKYGHIHAHQCDAGVPYTSRKRPPGQLLRLA
jgi:hypothetical protein